MEKWNAEYACSFISILGILNPTSSREIAFMFEGVITEPTNRTVMIFLSKLNFKGKSNYNEMRVI